jgi:hypothetical protein
LLKLGEMKQVSIAMLILCMSCCKAIHAQNWRSQWVNADRKGTLSYVPDAQGNVIPDFSKVGYNKGIGALPTVPIVKIVEPSESNSQQVIQAAIDSIAQLPLNKNGFRGAILLKKGVYKIPGTVRISTSGIVLRGEGPETKLVATGKGQRSLIFAAGKGAMKEEENTRKKITDTYVPVGAKSFSVASTERLKTGDRIVVFRPGTQKWISDLKMDQIEQRDSTIKQWQPAEYDLYFERTITQIQGNKIHIDYPVVMAMEEQYGGGCIFKYSFEGRINNVGVEYLTCESEYKGEEDEDHGWNAVLFNRLENGWVRHVTARNFGYSCVNLGAQSRNITVDSCQYLQPKSIITGGRRYSFNNDGQLNLIKNCFASEGRHDYVTGAKVCGPNVFYNCKSEKAKADIGPHHRWAVGTLYDNIVTDGEINVQDRGNWGTGHGWAGVTQVIWNCTADKVAIQSPWVSGKNYAIGLKGEKYAGRLKGRPDGEWQGQNQSGLIPTSLFIAQLQQRVEK